MGGLAENMRAAGSLQAATDGRDWRGKKMMTISTGGRIIINCGTEEFFQIMKSSNGGYIISTGWKGENTKFDFFIANDVPVHIEKEANHG
jgi:hypothetical protein